MTPNAVLLGPGPQKLGTGRQERQKAQVEKLCQAAASGVREEERGLCSASPLALWASVASPRKELPFVSLRELIRMELHSENRKVLHEHKAFEMEVAYFCTVK